MNSYLSHDILTKLATANAAQARAGFEMIKRNKNGSGAGGQEPVLEGWMYGQALLTGDTIGGEGRGAEAKEKRREVWRQAAMLVSTDPDEGDSGEDGEGQRHLRDMTTMSSLTTDEAWLEVEAMEKLPVLSLRLNTLETTLNSVTNGEATLGINFEPDSFEGQALFGRAGPGESQEEKLCLMKLVLTGRSLFPDIDEEDLKVVARLGGTFQLTATKKSFPRLERLIEFLAFAVISLRLEAVLLEDLGCPRPTHDSTSESSCPSPLLDSSTADANMDEEEGANTSIIDPKLPGSYDFDEGEPDDDWGYTKRSWRSSFSNNGVLAWMRLANPRAQLPLPLKSNRSLRRSSTLPSNDPSPRILRAISTIPVQSLDSPSPSPSPDGKRHKVANKLRGIRNQLRDKIGRNKAQLLSPTTSDDEDEIGGVPVERAKGAGGNTSALGLRIAGIESKSSTWSLPWSTLSSRSEDSVHDEAKDDASVAPTEVTVEEGGEKQPPKRFEKVIEDLSQFILSTSPDVLYPPPHLLFRLRQQELEASLVPVPSTPLQLPSAPPSPSPSPIPSHVFSDIPRSTFLNPRSASTSRPSALQRAHALPSSHSLALNFAEGLPTNFEQPEAEERRTTNSSTANRIGLDARASLASLMTNNSSLGSQEFLCYR